MRDGDLTVSNAQLSVPVILHSFPGTGIELRHHDSARYPAKAIYRRRFSARFGTNAISAEMNRLMAEATPNK